MNSESKSVYDRILLKISGEFFQGKDRPLSFESIDRIASQIKNIYEMGVQVGIVVGGGNIIRGATEAREVNLPSEELDELGMQATIINGGALASSLKNKGVPNAILSAISLSPSIGESYNSKRVEELFSKEFVLIFVGGTGNPLFTTDTASVLRAIQIKADVLLKATRVEGVYDKDPEKYEDACLYQELSFKEALEKELKIMDLSAFSMALTHNLPIVVFNASLPGNIERAAGGEKIGTTIEGGING
ncbi:UMP kinase [candidate division WOR-3 bacterium]|nr:UMP kinase [candidate division WOR-3 bacterium]MCK4527387.1 UMP kinase [candidate division WOR-3 bacterium]